MTKLTGVSVKKIPAPAVDKQFAKLIDELPHLERHAISLTVLGTSAYANAIVRTARSELAIWVMDTDISNVSGTDTKVVSDFVITRLNLIPIMQKVAEDPSFRATIDFENQTDEIVVIHSRDILFEVGGKPIDYHNVCDGTYPIVAIQPNRTIRIDNIQARKGYGYENAAFQPIGATESSPEERDVKYAYTFRTFGTIKPDEFLPIVFQNIIDRLASILEVLETVKDVDITTESVSFTFTSEINVIEISNETHTIGHLLMRAIYDVDPSVSNDSYKVPHPTSRRTTIRFKGTPELARQGCRHAIGVYRDFMKVVKK
jgi:DNA-directed RNA polymerase subunit L